MSTRDAQRLTYGAAANLSRERNTIVERDGSSPRRGTDISFTAPDTITKPSGGFNLFEVGDIIEVLGSPMNSRRWVVAAKASTTITVTIPAITTESAGPTIVVMKAE